MIDKEKIKLLFREKKYKEISYIFKNEYKEMLFKFAENNNIHIDDYTEVEDLLFLIPNKYPNLEGCIDLISFYMYSEETPIIDNLDYMISNYNKVKHMLT